MPVLKNPKHELFAQALAKGMSQVDAYESAGYEPDMPNACRLTRNDKVKARVRELQNRVAARTEETVEGLTAELRELAEKANQTLYALGAPGMQVVRAAIMDIAKLNGLIIDRTINERKDTVDLTRAELMDLIRQRRGLGSGDARSDGRGREPDRVYRMDLLPIPDRKAS
jgi:phage terminase small subunit